MKEQIEALLQQIQQLTGAQTVVGLIQAGEDKYIYATGDAMSCAILTLDAAEQTARMLRDTLASAK